MHTTILTFRGLAKTPWNKGRLIGQKRPLRPKDVWAIRVRLQLEGRKRDLALFNLAIDSKLRGCDLVSLQVEDVCAGGRVRDRGTVIQKESGRPVQFEIPLDPSIRADRACLGRKRWARQLGLRHPLDAPDEGGPNLSKNGQPASGPAIAGAYKAGEHGTLPRDRGR